MSAQQLKEFIRAATTDLDNAIRNEKWTLVQFNATNIARAASIVELEERQDEAGCVKPRSIMDVANKSMSACLAGITGMKL